MKQGMIQSYIAGITDTEHGERYVRILRYFIPEFISAFLLYSMPLFLDAYFIGQLASTPTYATLGATNNLIHFIIKIAEAFSVGTVIICGQLNGAHAYQEVGKSIRDAFWVTCFVGLVFALGMYFGSYYIYLFYGVPREIAVLGIPFLRIRAISVFFMFIYMALVGFLRGIKNTRAPMYTFIFGAVAFIFFDYSLVLGNFGFPRLELQGSAIASTMQYFVMFSSAMIYIAYRSDYRKYSIQLFQNITSFSYAKEIIALSWPVILDKATMASAYIWLQKMINPMGTCTIASFCVLRDIERFAFLPAIAFAQVITFLVSNDFGMQHWEDIKSNIKKVCFLASMMVFTILLFFLFNIETIIKFFDKKGDFTDIAAQAFPFLSVLVFFDLVQLLLSGALRGAGNVKIVMFVRILVCFGYFVPISYILSHMHFHNETIKFILIYSSFYVGNALMNIAYIARLRSEEWKVSSIKGNI